MKLYTHEESGNSYKVRLLLSFLKLEIEEIEINLFEDEQHQPEFLAINPRGEVPTLTNGNVTIRDSSAIMMYLACLDGMTPWWSDDAVEQAAIMEWLAFSASWVQYGVFSARALVSFGFSGNGLPMDFKDDLEAATLRGHHSLEILNTALESNQWLACGRPTIADIAVFPYIALAPMGDISLEGYPNVLNWIARIKQLPNFISLVGIDDPNYRKQ